MADGDMHLLDFIRLDRRNRNGDIREAGELTPRLAGEADCANANFLCRIERLDHIGAVAARGEADKHIALPADTAQLAGEHFVISIIVGDRRQGGRVHCKGERREWPAVSLTAAHKLGGQVLRVGCRTTVSAKEYFPVHLQRGDDHFRGGRHLVDILLEGAEILLSATKIKEGLLTVGKLGKRLGHEDSNTDLWGPPQTCTRAGKRRMPDQGLQHATEWTIFWPGLSFRRFRATS